MKKEKMPQPNEATDATVAIAPETTPVSSSPVIQKGSTKSSKNTTIIILIVVLGLAVLCCLPGAIAVYTAMKLQKEADKKSDFIEKYVAPSTTTTTTPAQTITSDANLKSITAITSLEKANALAKEKYPNSVLVLVADDQGKSSLYYTIGGDKTKEKDGNKSGLAKRWMYVYLKDPAAVTTDDKDTYFGKYKVKKDQGFIVDGTSEGVTFRKDTLFGDYSFHSISNLTDDLKVLESEAAVAKVLDVYKTDIQDFGFKPEQLQDIDVKIQYITYVDILDKSKSEVRPIWNIDVIYADPTSSSYEKTRSFTAKVNAKDGKVEKGIIYPAKK